MELPRQHVAPRVMSLSVGVILLVLLCSAVRAILPCLGP